MLRLDSLRCCDFQHSSDNSFQQFFVPAATRELIENCGTCLNHFASRHDYSLTYAAFSFCLFFPKF
jgi:hypothetical protein